MVAPCTEHDNAGTGMHIQNSICPILSGCVRQVYRNGGREGKSEHCSGRGTSSELPAAAVSPWPGDCGSNNQRATLNTSRLGLHVGLLCAGYQGARCRGPWIRLHLAPHACSATHPRPLPRYTHAVTSAAC